MNDVRKMGRVTIPTDTDAVSETLDLLKRWGADAIRDCDGTEFPQELKDTGAKIYATYYTTRKDNAWAKANPDETQQCYIMTPFYTAEGGALTIPLMTGISRELMKVNDHDDIARWWEVMDRTTGEPVPTADWHYDAARESVVIDPPAAYHEYTVSFLGGAAHAATIHAHSAFYGFGHPADDPHLQPIRRGQPVPGIPGL